MVEPRRCACYDECMDKRHTGRSAATEGRVGGELQRLRDGIARRARNDGPSATAISSLIIFKHSAPDSRPHPGVYEPSICLSAQGAKRVLLGGETYTYKPGNFLIASVHLPAVFQVIEASPSKPLLGLVIRINPREVSELMLDSKISTERLHHPARGMALGEASQPLLASVNRLLDVLDSPQDIPILAPLILREITYRLLTSDQGARLRQVALAGSQGRQIAQAIEWLKAEYALPFKIEELAERVHMSVSAFHQHFRAVTAMSPLQFQKWLRLNEARRIMLAENLNAGTAALRVGYESPSQFSREYRRLFEQTPLQDIKRLRGAAAGA